MRKHPALPLQFTALRHYNVQAGAGAIAAVFFKHAHAARHQQDKPANEQDQGKRKAKGVENV